MSVARGALRALLTVLRPVHRLTEVHLGRLCRDKADEAGPCLQSRTFQQRPRQHCNVELTVFMGAISAYG